MAYMEVKSYVVYHYSGYYDKRTATIMVMNPGHPDSPISLRFYPSDIQLPENTWKALNFPASEFDTIITSLRYEKPLYVLTPGEGRLGYLTTQMEPPGEQEGV